jgi:predicted nuclease with TOPRIM domain
LTIEITTIQQTSALQITRAGDETRELRNRLQSAQQDSEELRRRLKDVDGLHDKLSDYENKMSFLTKEIERLNIVLKAKVDEAANLQKANHDLAE